MRREIPPASNRELRSSVTGAYLAAIAAGKEPLEAFGITAALICAHVAIFVFHGAPDDYNKLPLAWLALFGALAFKALN